MYSSQSRDSLLRDARPSRSQSDLYASLGLEIDTTHRGPYQPSTNPPKAQQNTKSYFSCLPSKNAVWRIFAYFVIVAYLVISILQISPSHLSVFTESVSLKILANTVEEELQFEDEIPVYFRNVVLDLPVSDEDVPIMWTHDMADSEAINNAYENCYDVELINKEVSDLSSFGRRKVYHISDLQVQTIDDIVTEESQGRMFAFFRHPYHGFLEKNEQPPEDNPLVRAITGGFVGPLTFKELGLAKRKLRERFVIGLLDEHLIESFHRIADYFGWTETGGPMCVSKSLSTVKHDHYGELMHEESDEWESFVDAHKLDLQLYEYARSVFRGQKQTIISLEKQILFREMDEN